jgi:hypothetical protein
MAFDPKLRVPVDAEYAEKLGKAVYVFAYYESTVVQIIDRYEPGFRQGYYRAKTMTSGPLAVKFRSVIGAVTDFSKLPKDELQSICDDFDNLVYRRNALVHGHPATSEDGEQILVYQGAIKPPTPENAKKITDAIWPKNEVDAFLYDADAAAVKASYAFDKIR